MMSRTPWTELVVLSGSGRTGRALGGPERLAELYRWRDGAISPDRRVADGDRASQGLSPRDIDWRGFPEQEAVRTIVEEDLRGLRRRLSSAVRSRSGRQVSSRAVVRVW
jgi:hypothetical protein